MPIYVYRCTEHGHEIEVVHGIDAAGPATCDVCGAAMRKALTTPAIHFKGSGWAKKDAQAASKAKATKAADGSKSSDGTGKSAADGGSAAETGSSSTAASGDGGTKGEAKPKVAATSDAPGKDAPSKARSGKPTD